MKSITFNENKVTSTIKDCPSFAFTLLQQDGENIDPELFVQISQMLKIYTEDDDMIGTYPLQLIASFDSSTFRY